MLSSTARVDRTLVLPDRSIFAEFDFSGPKMTKSALQNRLKGRNSVANAPILLKLAPKVLRVIPSKMSTPFTARRTLRPILFFELKSDASPAPVYRSFTGENCLGSQSTARMHGRGFPELAS